MITLPFWALSALSGIKKLFASLTWKHYVGFAVILLLVFAQWMFYGWAKENGKEEQLAIDTPIIEQLQKDLKTAQDDLSAYKASFDTWKQVTDEANRILAEQNKLLSESLAKKILENRALTAQKQKVLVREIPTFIPSSVDFELPRGFVQLYNFSTKTATASEEYGISFRPEGDVTAPSGITLSRATEVLIGNNAECLRNQFLVEQWQEWYRTSKKNFDDANAIKTDAVNKMQETDDRIPAPTPASPSNPTQ